jgi:hypothetical protein
MGGNGQPQSNDDAGAVERALRARAAGAPVETGLACETFRTSAE